MRIGSFWERQTEIEITVSGPLTAPHPPPSLSEQLFSDYKIKKSWQLALTKPFPALSKAV